MPSYLTSSNEVGHFLSEEAFEWNSHGTPSDASQSLQDTAAAASVWRLKITSGSVIGAFYGWRVVLYLDKKLESTELTVLYVFFSPIRAFDACTGSWWGHRTNKHNSLRQGYPGQLLTNHPGENNLFIQPFSQALYAFASPSALTPEYWEYVLYEESRFYLIPMMQLTLC